MDLEEAFQAAMAAMTFQVDEAVDRPSVADMKKLFAILEEHEFTIFYEEYILFNFLKDLKGRIIPSFRKQVLSGSAARLMDAVKFLYENVKWYFYVLPAWPNPQVFGATLRRLFMDCLLWELDDQMLNVFAEFYAHAFQISTWRAKQKAENDISIDEEDDVEDHLVLQWKRRKRKILKSDCDAFLSQQFQMMTNHYLFDLNLLSTLVDRPVAEVMGVEVKRYVEKTCKGEYERNWIHTHLTQWVETEVMQWLENVFGKLWNNAKPSQEFDYGMETEEEVVPMFGSSDERRKWLQKLSFILYETYTELRISEMFIMITDFPESSPAIEDLKICLERTNQRPHLIETLKKDLSSRVLHPGVCTKNIISMYIGAVKALRLLDPSGVVMEIVLEPYTKYLTGRDDAVRMIMMELLEDDRDSSDLAMELARGSESATGPLHVRGPDDSFIVEQVTKRPEDWVPDPREADPEKPDRSRRTSDIISLLVGMYGSTKRFIDEYQGLLSRKLLTNWCAGISEDAEIKNLELLKLRFGEDDMGQCAVMLKDVADSRRVNTYVRDEYSKQNETKSDIEVNTLIISSEYWPDMQTFELNLPPVAQQALDEFKKGYEAHKASRTLNWLHNSARVDIEIELKSRTLQMQVTPLLASIVALFQDKETWTLSDISAELKVSESTLRRKITFWEQQGVLRETASETYTVIEGESEETLAPSTSTANLENLLEEEEADDGKEEENQKQKQKEQVLWNYIKGMLMNFESLPLDRIHKMLRMFAMQDSSMQMDQGKLRSLLNGKVQEGVLSVEAGKYQLNKDA